jgi:hypothetical protein
VRPSYSDSSGARRAGAFPRAGIALVLALAACAAADNSTEDSSVRYATYQATTALGEGDGAALDGILTTRRGCLVVETDGGSVVVPLLPASSTTWDGGAERLTVGSSEYRVGDRVSFGGGYTEQAPDADLPEGCAELGQRFVVSTP